MLISNLSSYMILMSNKSCAKMLILSYFFIQHKIQLKRLLKCSFFHPRSNHLSNNCISWGGGGDHAQVSLTTGCIPENYRFPAPHHTNDWYYVVTGNKQGCWFTSGWMEKEDGRLDLLSCLLSGAFIEKKFTRKLFIQVLYAPILSFSHCIHSLEDDGENGPSKFSTLAL